MFNETEFPACENPVQYPTPDPKSHSPDYWLTHLLSTHSCTLLSCSHCPNHSASVQTPNPNTVIDPSPHTAINIPTVPTTSSLITFPLTAFPQSPAPNSAAPQSPTPISTVTPAYVHNSTETTTPAPNSAVTPSPAPTSAEPAPLSPLPAPIPNNHLMQTRSKHGILNPRLVTKPNLTTHLYNHPLSNLPHKFPNGVRLCKMSMMLL